MDFLTQEQLDEITGLKADYQSALTAFLNKHKVVQALDEKLAAIDKTIVAAEGEAEASRVERKSLIASLLDGDTKPLKTAKAKERAAYAVVEDYQELRTDLIKERKLLAFEAMTARDHATSLRERARIRIGDMLHKHAIQAICQSPAMTLLVSALRMQPDHHEELPNTIVAKLPQFHAQQDWFARSMSKTDIDAALSEISKKINAIAPIKLDFLADISTATPCCNAYEWLGHIAIKRTKQELGLN